MHNSYSNTAAAQSPSLALPEECLNSRHHMRRASEIMPLLEPQILLTAQESSVNTEMNVKLEPMDNVGNEEQAHGKFMNEMGESTSPAFIEKDLSQYTSSNTVAAQSPSSTLHEECLDSDETVQRASEVSPLPKPHFSLMIQEPCIDSEITVKHELIYSEDLELKLEQVDDVEIEEQDYGKFMNEMDEGTSPAFSEQDLIQYTCSNTFAAQSPSLALKEECLDSDDKVQRASGVSPLLKPQISLMIQESCVDSEITVKHELIYSESMELKLEHVGDDEVEDQAPEKFINEGDEGTSPVFHKLNLSQYTTAGTQGVEPHEDGSPRDRESGSLQVVAPSTKLPAEEQGKAAESPVVSSLGGAAVWATRHLNVNQRTQMGDRPYLCDVCGAAFNKKKHLTAHLRKHTGDRPYRCDVCGLNFPYSNSLTIHKRIHTGERPYRCDICGNCFTQLPALVRHKRRHTGERPYRCAFCGDSFTDHGHLVHHKRIHTGERPFRCDVCGNSFTQSGHLLRHKRCHTGERSNRCDVCGICFTELGNLVSHKRIHTGERPYCCDICGICFTQLGNLVSHKRTHTGERPFRCDVCGICFAQLGNLVSHKRVHTGERPYRCDVCDVAFTNSGGLSRHKWTHSV